MRRTKMVGRAAEIRRKRALKRPAAVKAPSKGKSNHPEHRPEPKKDQARRKSILGHGPGTSGKGSTGQPVEEAKTEQQPTDVRGKVTRAGILLQADPNDEGNAQCFKALYGNRYLYCQGKVWLHYNGRFWEKDPGAARRAMVKTLTLRRKAVAEFDTNAADAIYRAARQSASGVRNALTMASSILPCKWTDFDLNPDELNCANGVLNLRTGALVLHDGNQRFTYCLKTRYNPKADASLWIDFLRECLREEGDSNKDLDAKMAYIQEAVGYTITGWTREECLFYLQGVGRAGMGVFTETIGCLLGLGDLANEVVFETFSATRGAQNQSFDLAGLRGCRFLSASEGQRHSRLNEAFLKRITGGNPIRAAFKHQDFFTYRSVFKVWLSSNFEPRVDPGDNAAWSRIRVIHFPNSHIGTEDKSIKEKMRTPAILESILAWAVEGANRWYAHKAKGLSAPPFIQEATDAARQTEDYVREWAGETLIDTGNKGDVISTGRYYENFKWWYGLLGGDMQVRGQRTVTKDLRRLGYRLTKSGNVRGLSGYQLRARQVVLTLGIASEE